MPARGVASGGSGPVFNRRLRLTNHIRPCIPAAERPAQRVQAVAKRWSPILIAGVSLTASGAAHSADWYTGAEPQRPDSSWLVTVDTSAVVTSNQSTFGSATLTVGPRADESGFRVRVEGVVGEYSYRGASERTIRGYQQEGSLLAGYEVVWRDAALAGYVGLHARNNDLSFPDPNNPVKGTDLGGKVAVNFYATPTDNTFFSAYGSYATTFNAYYARARYGVMVADGVYVGPEALVLGDDFFRQWRVGVHLTGMSFGPVTLSTAVGYAHDRIQKGGYYSTVEARMKF